MVSNDTEFYFTSAATLRHLLEIGTSKGGKGKKGTKERNKRVRDENTKLIIPRLFSRGHFHR
jgi:hypothetical protein